jgi:hypothetical protein
MPYNNALPSRSLNLLRGQRVALRTVDLGLPRRFVAWIQITWINPTTDFDSDNAIGVDIPYLNFFPTTVHHSGEPFTTPPIRGELYQATLVQTGRYITFRIRNFGPDIEAGAEMLVIYE